MIQPLARRDSEPISQTKMANPQAGQLVRTCRSRENSALPNGFESLGIVPEWSGRVPQGMLKDMCVAVFAARLQRHEKFIAGSDPRFEVREAVAGFTGFHETAISYTFVWFFFVEEVPIQSFMKRPETRNP